MKKIILFFFLFSFAISTFSQVGFEFVKTKNSKVKVPVKLINNLVFIPVKINGVELLFLLDTGVKETILFGFDEAKKIALNKLEKVNFKGLGTNETVGGFKSSGNFLTIGDMQSKNHLLYLISDSSSDLSSFVGISVNGIVGSAAFKNHLVEIDYLKKVVIFHKLNSKFHKKIDKKYTKVPIVIEGGKPYVNSAVKVNTEEVPVKLLIDSGNSDAVWLFDELSDQLELPEPEKYFEDYLGQSLSGAVVGKRARIAEFSIADFKFESPIVAFPDSISVHNINLQSGRLGSLGGEILKRFSVVFDYSNRQLFLKKNKAYASSFFYNKSGIEIWHTGSQWIKHVIAVPDNATIKKAEDKNTNADNSKMQLKPIYEIGHIREKSNAAKSGLREGDILVAIDGKTVFDYSLQEINAFLWSEDEIWIEIKILREGKEMSFKFQLLNVL